MNQYEQIEIKNVDNLTNAIYEWENSGVSKGEVFTNKKTVEFMIDISEIFSTKNISHLHILEPSCGQGDFVIPIAEQLLRINQTLKNSLSVQELSTKIRAYDLISTNIEIVKKSLKEILKCFHYSPNEIQILVNSWIIHGDFLQEFIELEFTHIIGNPPYVRVENVPKELLSYYRNNFSTMSDRADLYIPFFEKSLSLLKENGKLCFVCTDRWMKNKYGKKLRKLISENFSLDFYIELNGYDTFKSKALTYPAITIISKNKKSSTLVCKLSSIENDLQKEVIDSIHNRSTFNEKLFQISNDIVKSDDPWLFDNKIKINLIRKLESNFNTMEEEGCNVFIGAATGNNKVFIIDETINIEVDRKIPTITARDIKNGTLCWSGKYIINTYDKNGTIDLKNYPLLNTYLQRNKSILSKRHIAQKSNKHWYKTIDKVYPERALMEKLIIPDIKLEFTAIYDEGNVHPNNSLYYICSDKWNLHALKAVLISGIGKFFISAYSTKISHGFLRFQAQHLRRIRIPNWDSISEEMKIELIEAGKMNDTKQSRDLTSILYGLNKQEKELIGVKLK